MSDLSPLSGVKRKLDFGAVRAALDPERTSDLPQIYRSLPDAGGREHGRTIPLADMLLLGKECLKQSLSAYLRDAIKNLALPASHAVGLLKSEPPED